MSVKIRYLFSHLYCSKENLDDVREEQRERFYQDIKTMGEIHQGRWGSRMMSD